jgi:serine/threonine-protein kinase
VLFTAWHGSPERSGIAVLSPDGRVSTLLSGGTQPRFAQPGYLLFAVDNALRAVRFDPVTLSVTGQPVTVVEGIGMTTQGGAHYAVGANGSLVYATGNNLPRTLVWVDRQGHEEAINAPARDYVYARLSPDGTRIALDARDQESDIWIWDLKRETLQRLTTDPGLDRLPVWSADGARIAFMAHRGNAPDDIYWQAADGSGVPERLGSSAGGRAPESFTPDGRYLLFSAPLNPPYDVGLLSLDGERRESMLVATRFNESNGVVSPDGRWLAYQSDESGPTEIYVSPFPNVGLGKRPVSNGGGSRPLWSKDGRELFYFAPAAGVGTIMAVPVVSGTTLSLGKPEAITKARYFFSGLAGRHYDVSPDGKRLLLLKEAEGAGGERPDPEIHIVLNWTEELKEKVRR